MAERKGLLHVIAVFKLFKAAVLIAVAIGAFELVGGDTAEDVRRWSRELHIHGRYADELIAKIGGTSVRHLAEIGVGTLVYAGVFLVEGIGLWLRAVWAEYLTLIVTTSFVPLEIYEALQSATPTRIITIIVNVLVMVYLVLRLKRDHHWPFRRAKPPRRESSSLEPAERVKL